MPSPTRPRDPLQLVPEFVARYPLAIVVGKKGLREADSTDEQQHVMLCTQRVCCTAVYITVYCYFSFRCFVSKSTGRIIGQTLVSPRNVIYRCDKVIDQVLGACLLMLYSIYLGSAVFGKYCDRHGTGKHENMLAPQVDFISVVRGNLRRYRQGNKQHAAQNFGTLDAN